MLRALGAAWGCGGGWSGVVTECTDSMVATLGASAVGSWSGLGGAGPSDGGVPAVQVRQVVVIASFLCGQLLLFVKC
jgi:hypothetical protein